MHELNLIQYGILKEIPHCFTTRTGGVSAGAQESLNMSFTREPQRSNVLENYRRVSNALGVDFCKMTQMPQVHGNSVFEVTPENAGMGICTPYSTPVKEHGYDAMITNMPGAVLCTVHADCVPVLLYDPVRRAAGAVHSGWRSTVQQISAKTVETMKSRYGTNPADIIAVIGPSIGIAQFETDDDVYDAFCTSFGDFEREAQLFYRKGDKYHLSVSGFVYRTLTASGLQEKHIFYDKRCTYENPELFFSHRRDKGNTGAMCAVISLGGSV